MFGVVAVLAAAVIVPRLAGATPFTVLTGSMRPNYPPGTLVVVKPVPFDDIVPGDVITYQLESGKSAVVTHRVITAAARLDGETVLTTKGDANNVADEAQVREQQVRGRLWYSVPYLGYVNNALTGRQRQTAVLIVSVGLIGYAAFMLVGAFRDRRRKKKQGAEEVFSDTQHQQDQPKSNSIDVVGHDPQEVNRESSNLGRNAILVLAGLLALGLTFRLIKAHRGRSSEQPTT